MSLEETSQYARSTQGQQQPKVSGNYVYKSTSKVNETNEYAGSTPSRCIYEPEEISPEENNHSKSTTKMKQVELVEGYGVYLTKQQYDQVLDESRGSPTRMIRNLMTVYFTPTILANSSCLGKRGKNPPLNPDIVKACLKFVMDKFPSTKKSILINDINDKCANYRRKAISQH